MNVKRNRNYILLSFFMLFILGISVGYAALSQTLMINGTSDIDKSVWDVHYENIQVTEGSVNTDNIPTMDTEKSIINFHVVLSKPGDFYEFTIDVVNVGTIDAMLESVNKTPTLTEAQSKYINYKIEYENGEKIQKNQILKSMDSVRVKVRIEFKKDITENDLLSEKESLNLGLNLNYIQSDDTAIKVFNNGYKIYIVEGDLNTPGSQVSLAEENFYIIDSNEEELILFSKYNLYIGDKDATGIQDPNMIGFNFFGLPVTGTTKFSTDYYWWDVDNLVVFPEYLDLIDCYRSNGEPIYYVYNNNAEIHVYVDDYKEYLISKGYNIPEARLLKVSELISTGCDLDKKTCKTAPEWTYSTTYWLGAQSNVNIIFTVNSMGGIGGSDRNKSTGEGVRPVVILKK